MMMMMMMKVPKFRLRLFLQNTGISYEAKFVPATRTPRAKGSSSARKEWVDHNRNRRKLTKMTENVQTSRISVHFDQYYH